MKPLWIALALGLVTAAAAAQERPRDWQPPPISQIPNFREQWRQVVIQLGNYAKGRRADFVVLVRGGVELSVKGEREADWEQAQDPTGRDFEKRLPLGAWERPYLKVIDGEIMNGLYCGPMKLEKPVATLIAERRDLDAKIALERSKGIERPAVPLAMGPFSLDPAEEIRRSDEVKRQAERGERIRRVVHALDAMRETGRVLWSLDRCDTDADARAALAGADRDKLVGWAKVGEGDFDRLPTGFPHFENASPVTTIAAARNWLMMTRGDRFGTKAQWMIALQDTNYDALVVDAAFRGQEPLTKADVRALKFKKLGGPRLVLADIPIGRAFDWRMYWKQDWHAGSPPFLFAVDPKEPGAYIADLADPAWKEILGKYVAWVVDLGFDGVVLDDLDTYLWFEDLMPVND